MSALLCLCVCVTSMIFYHMLSGYKPSTIRPIPRVNCSPNCRMTFRRIVDCSCITLTRSRGRDRVRRRRRRAILRLAVGIICLWLLLNWQRRCFHKTIDSCSCSRFAIFTLLFTSRRCVGLVRKKRTFLDLLVFPLLDHFPLEFRPPHPFFIYTLYFTLDLFAYCFIFYCSNRSCH